MKKSFLIEILTLMSLSSIQMVHPITQKVRASKADPRDTKKVTIKITPEQQVPGGKAVIISESTFKQNTDRFAKKLKFDWSKGANKITLLDASQKELANMIARKEELPPEPEYEILINKKPRTNSYTLGIVSSKELKELKTAEMDRYHDVTILGVDVEDTQTPWLLVSGTNELTRPIARTKNTSYKDILDIREYKPEEKMAYKTLTGYTWTPPNISILRYKNKPTSLYIQNEKHNIETIIKLDNNRLKSHKDLKIDTKGKLTYYNKGFDLADPVLDKPLAQIDT